MRLEAGLPLYGHDLDENTDPATAGLGFAISKRRRREGGFPGATRILALLTEGAPVKRVGLSLEGRMPARDGRSEEHTSEHQSLMSRTYAVLCLTKKIQHHRTPP